MTGTVARMVSVILLGMLSLANAANADNDEPFGYPTTDALEGPIPAAWRRLQSEMITDALIVAECRARLDVCVSPAALRFIEIVDAARKYEGLARLGHLNRAVNLAIRPARAADTVPWLSPLDALDAPGDCKSYAVTKYAALGELGVAPIDLRLVTVHIHSRQVAHLVLTVRFQSQWLVLDDRSSMIAESTEIHDYLPSLVLDYRGVREFLPLYMSLASLPCDRTFG